MTHAKPAAAFLLVALASALGAGSGCKRRSPAALKAPTAPAVSAVSAASAARPPAPAPSGSASAADVELTSALQRWNDATNAGDGATLGELYAPHVSLYGRLETNAHAVASKVAARQKQPGFAQTIGEVHWDERAGGDRVASFDKQSRSAAGQRSVSAYLLLRRIDGKFRIVDEGDRQTDRTLQAKRDTLLQNWGERFFKCPTCEKGTDDPPLSFPPLGPSPVTPGVLTPPGAPQVVAYARLMLVRFASALDLPTFVNVTPESTNGDGRWFNFDEPADAGAEPKRLLDCATGGFWYYDAPQPGLPDSGHVSHPEITSTEKTFRDAEGIHYEKYIYSPEHIENSVRCTIDPRYEGYLMAIAQRAGRSLRALSGGMYGRPERASDPF